MSRQIVLHGNKAFGHEVSKYGLKKGYLDYRTLSKIVGDCILNNNIMQYTEYLGWDLVCGEDADEDGEYFDIFQWYIITEPGVTFLSAFTDEIVYYHEGLDMYLWAITHYGTSWDYVLTNIKLCNTKEEN